MRLIIEGLSPRRLNSIQAIVDTSMGSVKADEKYQFERHGCFVADRVDHVTAKPVFNLAAELKDSWGSRSSAKALYAVNFE